MRTLPLAAIPVRQLEELDAFARTCDPALRDVLLSVSRCVRDGADVVVVDNHPTLTPNQAAERLGMSRTHLYKLLDRGEIMSHRVGRDRRIRLDDIVQYESERQAARRELAERFAHQTQTRRAAIDEVTDLLD